MEKLIDRITHITEDAFEKAGFDRKLGHISVSNRPDLCEYQCNGAMAGAKQYHKAPIMIAEAVAEEMRRADIFASVEAVKPGFINIILNPAGVSAYLNEMRTDDDLSVTKT